MYLNLKIPTSSFMPLLAATTFKLVRLEYRPSSKHDARDVFEHLWSLVETEVMFQTSIVLCDVRLQSCSGGARETLAHRVIHVDRYPLWGELVLPKYRILRSVTLFENTHFASLRIGHIEWNFKFKSFFEKEGHFYILVFFNIRSYS